MTTTTRIALLLLTTCLLLLCVLLLVFSSFTGTTTTTTTFTLSHPRVLYTDLVAQQQQQQLQLRHGRHGTDSDGPAIDLVAAPMGWMSWERFRCQIDCHHFPRECISEDLYTSMADAVVTTGLRDAGYTRIHVDDCWMATQRDDTSNSNHPPPPPPRLVANATRFPRGMNYLADYLHARGLQLGLYSDVGTHTCGGYPGSQGYEELDAATFRAWGADYIKLDGCYMQEQEYAKYYTKWGNLLRQDQPMIFSCSWPAYLGNNETNKPFAKMYHEAGCNTWRNWADIDNSYKSLKGIIMHWAEYAEALQEALPVGAFHDADMLLVGDDHYGTTLPVEQARMQMGFWALIASPLLIAADIRTISAEYLQILLNRDVLAINQDTGRQMATCIAGCPSTSDGEAVTEEWQVWLKLLNGGRSVALGFFNVNEQQSAALTVSLLFPPGAEISKCFDLWAPGGTLVNLCPKQTMEDGHYDDTSSSPWLVTRRYLDGGSLEIIIKAELAPTTHQMMRLDVFESPK